MCLVNDCLEPRLSIIPAPKADQRLAREDPGIESGVGLVRFNLGERVQGRERLFQLSLRDLQTRANILMARA